jgi:hypothetical protein
MKQIGYMKIFTFLLGIVFTIGLVAQPFERDKVLLEIGTSFEDPLGVGALLGANELNEMGDHVAVLVYHLDDSLQDEYSLARAEFYNLVTLTNAVFNGTQFVFEANPNNSLYYPFSNKVNSLKTINSDFEIDLSAVFSDGNTDINVSVNKNPDQDYSNVNLLLAITQSGIAVNWMGMEEVNFITKQILPESNGTPISFTDNLFSYSVSTALVENQEQAKHCQVIAFIQDMNTHEVYQASSVPLVYPDTQWDAAIKFVNSPLGEFCGENIPVQVIIKNNGAATIESLHFDYSINNQATHSYDWTGTIPYGLNEMIELPAITAELQIQNFIDIQCSAPNGEEDEVAENNFIQQLFFHSHTGNPYTALAVTLKTDSYPEETSYLIRNSIGDTLFKHDNFEYADHLYIDTVYLHEQDCYNIEVFDSYGDGICCGNGNGYFKVEDVRGNAITEGGEFIFSSYKGIDLNTADSIVALFTADVTLHSNEGDTVHFQNLSFGAESYYWLFEGGEPSSSTGKNPQVIYADSGMFDVTLIVDTEGIKDTLTRSNYIVVGDPNGIVNNFFEKTLVYPNPFSNFALVEFFAYKEEIINIRMVDLEGRVVLETQRKSHVGENNFKLNTALLNKGMYLLVISSRNSEFKRLVLKNK